MVGAAAHADEKACKIELPVGLVDNNGVLLNGLTAGDVTIHLNKQSINISSIKYDTGTRRILLVMDTSPRLPRDARKAETAVVTHLLGKARPGDIFALITARGPLRKVHFDEGSEATLKAVAELASEPKEPVKGENVLDTVVEGISWFGKPQAGDTILILADHLEEMNDAAQYTSHQISGGGPLQGVANDRGPSWEKTSKIKFADVMKRLGEHRVRVFGLQLGALKTNVAVTAAYVPNDENLFGISVGSGGYALLDSVDAFGSYVLTDARLQGLQQKTWNLYGSIAQFYVVEVQAPNGHGKWKLDLAKDLRSNTRALYPELFDPCSSEAAQK